MSRNDEYPEMCRQLREENTELLVLLRMACDGRDVRERFALVRARLATPEVPHAGAPDAVRMQVGQVVRLSAKGMKAGFQGRAKQPTGKILGFYGEARPYVLVKRTGIKRPEQYHISFWESIP